MPIPIINGLKMIKVDEEEANAILSLTICETSLKPTS